MIVFLTFIFISLTLLVGGDRTAKSLITLTLNGAMLLLDIFLISRGFHPILTTAAACILISVFTLFYQNEVNVKTRLAFFSVMAVVLLLCGIIYYIVSASAIQGFPVDQLGIRDSNGYSRNIDRSMTYIQIAVILMVFIGAVIDTAITVSSAMYEVFSASKNMSRLSLFHSGMSIGRNILSSTINTLFFIYIAEYLTLFIQFADSSSLSQMINSKEFCQEFISIAFSGIGCVLIIPITALCGAWVFPLAKSDGGDSRI